MTDIIILLNGSYCPLRLADKEVADFIKHIKKAMVRSATDPDDYIETDTTLILSKYIIGYYTRPVVETPSEKAARLMEESANSNREGDEWKGK